MTMWLFAYLVVQECCSWLGWTETHTELSKGRGQQTQLVTQIHLGGKDARNY